VRALLLASVAAALSLQAQPRVQAFKLPNGLRVLHLEDHEHPLVRARLRLGIEPSDTPPGRQGLPLLAQRMFVRSEVANMKAEELDRLLEDSGIQSSASLMQGGLEWRVVARSRDQDRSFGLLADRLLRTIFDPSGMETQRLATWRQEARKDDDPFARLRLALAQDPDSKPTFASLGTITWEDLLTFRAKVFRPDRAVLVLHGDLGLEQAKRLVLLSLGSWTTQEPPLPLDPAARPSNQPAAPESPLRIAAPGAGNRIQAVAAPPSQLAPETVLLLSLLIQGNASLHPVRLEADQDGIVATHDPQTGASGPGAWSLLHERLEVLRRRGFTQADLDHARTAWQASRQLDSLHPETQMDAALAEATGRGATLEHMKSVSLEMLNEGLRLWLAPARIRSGAAGDPAWLKTLPKP
jgi:hypothetical protein